MMSGVKSINPGRFDERALVGWLRCPSCGGRLITPDPPTTATCTRCGAHYPCTNGIWHLLTEADARRYASFLAAYRPVRQHDGWERTGATYYLRLPAVAPDDPHAAIWRIRQRSFARLLAVAGDQKAPWTGRPALDLGAGNGWLARRLAARGFQVVAVDLHTVGPDSLAGATVYLEQAGVWFGRVQANMERLPFAAGTFALCTVSGALHYADLQATLHAIWDVLAPGGRLVITDSPVYTTAAAGAAMAAAQHARMRALTGGDPQWPGGAGYLVAADLWTALQEVGFGVQTFAIERPLGRLRRILQRVAQPHRREEARFPVVVGHKPGPGGDG